MTSTHEDSSRDVDDAAETLHSLLDGLELLGGAVDAVLDEYGEPDVPLRDSINEAILGGDPRPTQLNRATEDAASIATVVALTLLGETAEDDLEDPIDAWIQRCPKITALYRSDWGPGYWTDVSFHGCEILLPSHVNGVSARLITGDSDDYAQLIVSKGTVIRNGYVYCPVTIRKALNVVEGF